MTRVIWTQRRLYSPGQQPVSAWTCGGRWGGRVGPVLYEYWSRGPG